MVGHGKFSLSSAAVFTANWKLLATVLGYEKNEGKGDRFGKRALLNCVQYKTRDISSPGPLRTKVNATGRYANETLNLRKDLKL